MKGICVILLPTFVIGINRIPGFLGKLRPLNAIVSSRAIVSSVVENINTELISFDRIWFESTELASNFGASIDSHFLSTYGTLVIMFVYYIWAYIDANSSRTDTRLDIFPISQRSRKLTNQICIIIMFVFTKDVPYTF